MTEAPKRPSKGQRDSTKRPNKSPIRAPPRVALGQGRSSKAKDEAHEHGSASTEKSSSRSASQSQPQAPAHGSPSRVTLTERNKQLEDELRLMEEAFRKEHEQLSKRAIDESERAALANERCSDMHRDFLNKDTELQMLLVDFDRQIAEAERKTRYDCELRYRQERKVLEEAFMEKGLEVQRLEEESGTLRKQILGLKEFVSTNTRTEGQLTDDIIILRAKKLDGDLQNWVISNFRRINIDFVNLSSTQLQSLSLPVSIKHRYHNIPKVRFLQYIFSCILSANIFGLYFVGLSVERATELEAIEKFMSTIGDAASVNTWRSTTLGIIRRAPRSDLTSTTAQFIDDLTQRIEAFLTSLDISPSVPRTEALKPILLEAVELAQLFRVQKAKLEVCMFEEKGEGEGLEFDDGVMEDVGADEDDSGDERGKKVLCLVSPAIIKHGDEEGDENYLRNVLVKAKVLLEG